ncbi:MobC family plasmid mobilization relaxosome protein [Maridesulfovibrio sp.]|uniref:MobC family plasmid mobilization relaxosome protein n=1 Tax=Maridesulfovibrio sp. TaxID=2795000 RepID=UPI002AA7B98B|nr:MobC family plasmid mobilization relaxosome protein [Maridesulfovibrio sp.]
MTDAKKTEKLSMRVSSKDKELILAMAAESGMSMADFVRVRLGQTRVRRSKIEREKLLHLARIGNNLNQIARWANTHKSGADALLILAELTSIEQELKCI